MAPLTFRYNNPGAVEWRPWMGRYGASRGPNGRYAQFPSMDDGYKVMGRILDTYRDKHGLNTVSGIINRWAPRQVDNNSTDRYISSVANRLGIAPNSPLAPNQRMSLMQAMASYEAGRNAPSPQDTGGQPMRYGSFDEDSPMARTLGMYGYGPGMPMATVPQQQPIPQPQAMPQTPPSQPPQRSEPGGWLARALTSPLFLSGAAMLDAGSRGLNPGAGFLAGAQAASAARKQQAEANALMRAEQEEALRQDLWRQMSQGALPKWAANLPTGTLELARVLGPQIGSKFLMQQLTGAGKDHLGYAKLAETRRYHDIQNTLAEARLNESRGLNAERQALMTSTSAINEERLRAMQDQRRLREEITGTSRAPQPIPEPTAPSATDQNIRPQAYQAEAQDPNLIRTQTAETPDAVTPQIDSIPQEPMIKTHRGPMPLSQAEEMAYKMLSVPDFRASGQTILKEVARQRQLEQVEKGTRVKLEETLSSSFNHLGRLQQIASRFHPDFLKYKFRVGQNLNSLYAKFGAKLKPEIEQRYKEYVDFRATTVGNLNALLKELSGSAVSAQEFKRLTLQEPNAGTGGFFDAVHGFDSPPEFMSKLKTSMRGAKLAIARANYLRNVRGLKTAQIIGMAQNDKLHSYLALDAMPAIMKKMENKIRDQVRRQMKGAQQDAIDREVTSQWRRAFGV